MRCYLRRTAGKQSRERPAIERAQEKEFERRRQLVIDVIRETTAEGVGLPMASNLTREELFDRAAAETEAGSRLTPNKELRIIHCSHRYLIDGGYGDSGGWIPNDPSRRARRRSILSILFSKRLNRSAKSGCGFVFRVRFLTRSIMIVGPIFLRAADIPVPITAIGKGMLKFPY